MVLEALEGVKWNLSLDQWTSTRQHTAEDSLLQEREACRHAQTCGTRDVRQDRNECTHSDEDVNTLHVDTHTPEQLQDRGEEPTHQPKTFSVLSTDSGFEGNVTSCLQLSLTLLPLC